MINVKQLLDEKGHDIWFITPEASVYEALQLLSEKDVGAIMVFENNKLTGMFSERDYARKLALQKLTSKESKVRDVMSKELVVVKPETNIYDCMALMTKRRVRHLPVMEQNQIVGIISIGDVVNAVIREKEIIIKDLEDYILCRGYGADVKD